MYTFQIMIQLPDERVNGYFFNSMIDFKDINIFLIFFPIFLKTKEFVIIL